MNTFTCEQLEGSIKGSTSGDFYVLCKVCDGTLREKTWS